MSERRCICAIASLLLAACLASCGGTDGQKGEPSPPPEEEPRESAVEDGIALVFPVRAEDDTYLYYEELLRRSLEAAGHRIRLEFTESLPQKRAVEMLERGEISLYPLLETAERDEKFVPVRVDLVGGLLGHRVLLVPSGRSAVYAGVNSLEDFRRLGAVGSLGEDWFDCRVWESNGLPYLAVSGDWRSIYEMLERGDRGIDYFSRGVTEIVEDAKGHPGLEIEPRLVLFYDRDARFYLSRSAAVYRDVIESALREAEESGLMDEIIRKYWGEDLRALGYDERLKIRLDTPE